MDYVWMLNTVARYILHVPTLAGMQSTAKPRTSGTMQVGGCTHDLFANAINGTYQIHGDHHGKVMLKRDGSSNGYDSSIYISEELDGAQ